MPVVALVRHGQASFGADDYDVLSEHGRHQAQLAGAELLRRGLRDPLIVHGTLRRQRDTAALALPGVEARVDGRWDEYDHLGLLERYAPRDAAPPATSREVQVLLDAALASWVGDADGGFGAFAGGAADALADLVAGLPKGRDAVVVTSGGIVAALVAGLLGGGAEAVVALNRTAVNGAITTLVAGGSGTSLLTFNEHAHLPREDVTYR
ncbi:MAG TPA: histidine phosphatase family protein [Mycobacteriales bacterium]|nr:histidine phosphatase family protein [Mycobacteriales bacterium]